MVSFAAAGNLAEKQARRLNQGEWAITERDSVRFIRTNMRDGRLICIKYPLSQKAGLKYRLRKMLSAFIAQPFIRALPPLPAAEKNMLEITKLRAFKAAGLPVPEILAVQAGFSVFADMGKNIEEILKTLRRRDVYLHDGLLIRCGQALGRAHSAGLCQGRPDLRNMFLAEHGVGFSGFHEYPEQFMPKAAAQARDIWLLLALIAEKAADKDRALAGAFMAWRRQVGLETLESLRAGVRFFRSLWRPCRIFSPLFFGRALPRRLRVLQFLAANVGV